MTYEHSEFVTTILHKLAKVDYIRPGEVPNIDLYMDQVTTFMDSHLEAMKRTADDKILTKTMINNYAKNDLLPPPVKKKYSKDHMLTLIFIYYFKNLMSISDIQTILNPMTDKFFGDKGSVSIEHIYKTVYQKERERLPELTKEIISMFKDAEGSFKDVTNESDREYLQMFSFVCALSFDMYIKQTMLESVIDEFAAGRTFSTAKKNGKASDTADNDKKNTDKK